MFEYNGNIHVYCPGVGAYEPMGSILFRIINIQPYCPFPERISLKMTFQQFSHSDALRNYVDLAAK